jgi:hypothetical protein
LLHTTSQCPIEEIEKTSNKDDKASGEKVTGNNQCRSTKG